MRAPSKRAVMSGVERTRASEIKAPEEPQCYAMPWAKQACTPGRLFTVSRSSESRGATFAVPSLYRHAPCGRAIQAQRFKLLAR